MYSLLTMYIALYMPMYLTDALYNVLQWLPEWKLCPIPLEAYEKGLHWDLVGPH